MPEKPRILAFAGSTRRKSYNKKLLKIAAECALDAGAEVTLLDLRDYPLPLFDEDYERREGLPNMARQLKDVFLEHDGLLLACPEYNSSVTAVWKNAIDWVSRPVEGYPPYECLDGKVAAIISASPGGLGGLRGLVHVRAILSNIKVLVLPDQITLPNAHEAFKDDDSLASKRKLSAITALTTKLVDTIIKLK